MLSREVMGVLALAIVWVNTLLVLAVAVKHLFALRRLRDRGARSGVVVSGLGPAGALAEARIEQIGRWAADDDDRRAIAFADRAYTSAVHGGEVRLDDGRRLSVDATSKADVWPDRASVLCLAACPSAEVFDGSWREAKKPRGFVRTVVAPIREGDRVWVAGEHVEDGDVTRVTAPAGGELFVSAVDPDAFVFRKSLLVVAFLVGVTLAAAGCTALALTRPHFGTVSTIGGALCLAYFLLVQPVGTALRDAVRPPSRAILRGSWVDPAERRVQAPDGAVEPQA